MALVVLAPAFIIYKQKALPYCVALVQHSLLRDYLTGTQTQLSWPLTTQGYGIGLNIMNPTSMTLEWIVFLMSILFMLKSRDIAKFTQPHVSNLLLIIPTITILLPLILEFPQKVPIWLLPPHLIYAFLFLTAVLFTIFISTRNFFLGGTGHDRVHVPPFSMKPVSRKATTPSESNEH